MGSQSNKLHDDPARSALERLDSARRRTLTLLQDIPSNLMMEAPDRIMSPPVWDLAHVGNYEELWLLQRVGGLAPTNERYDDMYDAFRHERFERDELPLLDKAQALTYLEAVRERSSSLLQQLDLDDDNNANPLLASGFVVSLIEQHEHQHVETLLQARNLQGDRAPELRWASLPPNVSHDRVVDHAEQVQIAAGVYELGTTIDPRAYDNERPAHNQEVSAFSIDRYPVSNARYLEFINAGGYEDKRAWSEEGVAWRIGAGAVSPMGWKRSHDGSWVVERFGQTSELNLEEPVQHVCWYEADAFARWSGRRLPTEAEWEIAAQGAMTEASNLGAGCRGPVAVGSLPASVSAFGCEQMLGDVWEWTSSEFNGYPGFSSFPYREYSEVFFKRGYRVLRGGSWATGREVIRPTFRNWDLPQRRQLFAGLRTVKDAL